MNNPTNYIIKKIAAVTLAATFAFGCSINGTHYLMSKDSEKIFKEERLEMCEDAQSVFKKSFAQLKEDIKDASLKKINANEPLDILAKVGLSSSGVSYSSLGKEVYQENRVIKDNNKGSYEVGFEIKFYPDGKNKKTFALFEYRLDFDYTWALNYVKYKCTCNSSEQLIDSAINKIKISTPKGEGFKETNLATYNPATYKQQYKGFHINSKVELRIDDKAEFKKYYAFFRKNGINKEPVTSKGDFINDELKKDSRDYSDHISSSFRKKLYEYTGFKY